MSYERKKVIAKIFNQFDKGSISRRDLLSKFTPSAHPAVLTRNISSSQAMNHLESCFSKEQDVSWVEFLDYFKYLSPAIADDASFEDVARQLFRTSTGKIRRVLITYSDGTQQVAEVDDIIVNGPISSKQSVYSKLKELGFDDIADIAL